MGQDKGARSRRHSLFHSEHSTARILPSMRLFGWIVDPATHPRASLTRRGGEPQHKASGPLRAGGETRQTLRKGATPSTGTFRVVCSGFSGSDAGGTNDRRGEPLAASAFRFSTPGDLDPRPTHRTLQLRPSRFWAAVSSAPESSGLACFRARKRGRGDDGASRGTGRARAVAGQGCKGPRCTTRVNPQRRPLTARPTAFSQDQYVLAPEERKA